MRNYLIRLAIYYQGNLSMIKKALINQLEIDEHIPLQPAITILDQDYPKELFALKQPPYVLFYQGNIQLLKEDKIAIVGSRNCTEYGKQLTKQIVERLNVRYTLVSGLAKGIDAYVHINAKKSIAVLGNGINIDYPYCNKELYEHMRKHQLLLSEYPFDVKPEKYHFPLRNRIIAALAEKIIVTQAKIHSGTMLTVNEGLQLNKDIYATPYPFYDIEGAGCNRLIEQGAYILTSENFNSIFDK